MTVSCIEMLIEDAAETSCIMSVDKQNRIINFDEKPEHPSPPEDK